MLPTINTIKCLSSYCVYPSKKTMILLRNIFNKTVEIVLIRNKTYLYAAYKRHTLGGRTYTDWKERDRKRHFMQIEPKQSWTGCTYIRQHRL